MTVISMIAALDKNRVIGNGNKLPWILMNDLRHFRQTTIEKPVIMGWNTYVSMNCRALPFRQNLVLTKVHKTLKYYNPEVTLVKSIKDAINFASSNNPPEIMVIGGQAVYESAIEIADKLYLTLVDAEVEGDKFFPEYEHLFTKIKSSYHADTPVDDYPYYLTEWIRK